MQINSMNESKYGFDILSIINFFLASIAKGQNSSKQWPVCEHWHLVSNNAAVDTHTRHIVIPIMDNPPKYCC